MADAAVHVLSVSVPADYQGICPPEDGVQGLYSGTKNGLDALRFDPKDSELNMYAILAMGFQGNLSMAQTYYTTAKPYLALEHAEVIKKYLHIK